MKVLIAEDDPVSHRLLEVTLIGWNYEVLMTSDGRSACQALEGDNPPQLALLDWMLPEMDGLEICRRVRATPAGKAIYIILLTTRARKEDVIAGFDCGADDYVTKPFDRDELGARLRAGCRIVELQSSLAQRMTELEESLAQVKQLTGLLPICGWCKMVRDDQNYWQEVESYVAACSEVRFTHGICPSCLVEAEAAAHIGLQSPKVTKDQGGSIGVTLLTTRPTPSAKALQAQPSLSESKFW